MHVCVFVHICISMCRYSCVYYKYMLYAQLVRDLHLREYEEEIDAFFEAEITETVQKYQLETIHDSLTSQTLGNDNHIENFVQEALLWTAGKSRAEILQRIKFQPRTRQFMFVPTELPVDPTTAAHFLKAAHPSQKNPLCFKGTARKFLTAKAAIQSPPVTEVLKYVLHL